MTNNQINYQKLLEDKRHNRSVEKETKRHNLTTAHLQNKQIDSNRAIADMQLDHNVNVLSENIRHNTAVEQKDLMYATRSLDETKRHNIEQEAISKQNLDLTKQQINNNFAIGMANVGVAKDQVNLGMANLTETTRHNMQNEIELNRHNTVLESNDMARVNNEAVKIQNEFTLGSQRNTETQRYNVQQSLLHYKQLEEQNRHNLVTENIQDRAQVTNTLSKVSEQANVWFRTFKR